MKLVARLQDADRRRFLSFVKPDANSSCLFWLGNRVTGGYGRFCLHGQAKLAHRVAYEFTIGPIPEGLTIDHLCEVPRCVNPLHLEPVTQAENNRRADLGYWWRDRDRCANGHLFDDANTHIRIKASGSKVRLCRACARERTRRYRLRKGANA